MLSKWKPRENNQIYQLSFEQYLQPPIKKQDLFKKRMRHFSKRCATNLGSTRLRRKKTKRPLKLKLLQHPVLRTPRLWLKFYSKCKRNRRPRSLSGDGSGESPSNPHSCCLSALPACLAFLRARNDGDECRRKTGFEIYCELASVHGFVNFVGASTWQRVFWCFIVVTAILMSIVVLVLWYLMNVKSPTIIFTESTTHPAWTIPFPAVTLCNLNRISKRRAEDVAKKFEQHVPINQTQMVELFRYAAHTSDFPSPPKLAYRKRWRKLRSLLAGNNCTLTELLRDIAPSCESELLRCKWRGVERRCDELLHAVATTQGHCCSFNFNPNVLTDSRVLAAKTPSTNVTAKKYAPEYTASCGPRMGLTLLLDPHTDDHAANSVASAGYRLFLHSADAYPAGSGQTQQLVVHARSETHVSVAPRSTYATQYVRDWALSGRRCYLPKERKLSAFGKYTQANCLLECRARMMHELCGCLPAPWTGIESLGKLFPACDNSKQLACIAVNHAVRSRLTVNTKPQRQGNPICNCLPQCSFNRYAYAADAASLKHSFDRYFLKNITLKDHILLHVFYADLTAERLRLEMRENWLTFIGTFGGIVGLHMGYSFISGFEVIFFVFVRPACNWLTRQQIRYRQRRKAKQRVAATVGGGAG